jgi:cytochrome c oxidase subunit III
MKNRETSIRLGRNIVIENPPETLSMHPHKFAMWLFIVSIVMLFGAFTSAYIVRQGDGDWLQFDLPNLFWTNSVILILSSASMHWAYLMAKKDNQNLLKLAVSITVILGLVFLIGQVYAWGDLINAGIFFAGANANPSGSFLYVLTGIHGVHLISGVTFLLIVFYSAFIGRVHSKNLTRIEMCATYWHFLDILWLYLFCFLLLNH